MTVYGDVVLADSPYLLYPMDETSGTTAVDVSGNGLDGTISGSPALATRTVYGYTCTDLDGTNDYYQTPGINTTGWAGITVEALIEVDAVGSGTGVISEWYAGSGDRVTFEVGWSVRSSSGSLWGAARFAGSSGSWAATPNIGNPVGVGQHHIAATLDATSGLATVYVDGLALTSTVLGFYSDNDLWVFGRRHDGEGVPFFNGAMAYGAIYDYALTGGQVAFHHQIASQGLWGSSNAVVRY